MNNVNNYTLEQLKQLHPDLVHKYQLEWADLRYTAAINGMSEDEYVLRKANEALTALQDPIDISVRRRMSSSATLFRRENVSALHKDRYPTGFPRLDVALGGGLTAGLHVTGAVSSLGKSTFIFQSADYMAAHGFNVVLVSLEMSEIDITAKLVSRYTYTNSVKKNLAKTSSLLMGNCTKYYTDEEWDVIEQASDIVAAHGSRISVTGPWDGVRNVDDIADYLQKYIAANHLAPILIVDYLQFLGIPKNTRGYTDKQIVDYNISKLRDISNEYNIPVIVISALNRSSYDEKVSLKSFKDSGSIEYSSDTLIGLQLHGVGEKGCDFDADRVKAAYPRCIDLVILKQRYGPVGQVIPYDFYTKYNYFDEQELDKLPASIKTPFDEQQQLKISNRFGRRNNGNLFNS